MATESDAVWKKRRMELALAKLWSWHTRLRNSGGRFRKDVLPLCYCCVLLATFLEFDSES